MKKINLQIRKLLLKNSFYYVLAFLCLVYAFYITGLPKESIYKLDNSHFSGTLDNYTIKGNKLTFIIKGEESLRCNYYFNTLDELKTFDKNALLGAEISVIGTLKEPLNNTVPNTFNYKRYLNNQGIFYTCTAKEIDITSDDVPILYRVKNFVIKRIKSFEDIDDYLLTFIIGDKSLIDENTFENYRKNGVTHLFAISGMHIGLFSACILGILKKLKVSVNKRYIITVIFIWFYAFLTNFSPSVLRAGLLFTLLALNKIFYTEVKSINVLILTGCILIVTNPFILFNIAFIYSFLTTFGLMYSGETLKKHKILGTSIVAFLFSLPVTINNFYEFNILSVFFNIIFVPFVSSIVYPLCLISFVLPIIEPIVKIALSLLELLNNICASIPFGHIVIPKMSTVMIIIYYIVLLSLVNKRFKTCIVIIIIILSLNKVYPYFDSDYHIDFIDIGQGDSTLLRYPHNKEVVLIDTGGSISYEEETWKKTKKYNVSDNTITYLKSMGITKIDYLILTHGDADHLGDALNILKKIKVDKIILNRGEYNYNENKIREYHPSIVSNYNGIFDLKILWTNLENDENSNSLIILTKFENYKFLLMGDAPKKKELEVLKKYNLSNIDLIKLGHHGSKTSSDENFLKAINTKEAIISSGRNNKFNHPNKEVIDTLEKLNITYYNTQTSGTITYKISKNEVTIKECKP